MKIKKLLLISLFIVLMCNTIFAYSFQFKKYFTQLEQLEQLEYEGNKKIELCGKNLLSSKAAMNYSFDMVKNIALESSDYKNQKKESKNIIAAISVSDFCDFLELYSLHILCGIVVVIVFICYVNEGRCPKCKKTHVFKKTGSTFIRSEKISCKVEEKTKNRKGEVVRTTERYVPGTRDYYDDKYRCSNCGYSTTISRHEDKPDL